MATDTSNNTPDSIDDMEEEGEDETTLADKLRRNRAAGNATSDSTPSQYVSAPPPGTPGVAPIPSPTQPDTYSNPAPITTTSPAPAAATASLAADIKKSVTSLPEGSKWVPPDYTSKYVSELHQLADQYKAGAPPDTRASLQSAIDKADALYNRRTDKNDWLEVAQTLGRAVTQFAGAQAGMHTGRNVGFLDMGPGVDYQARNDRAMREYNAATRNAERSSEMENQLYKEQESARGRDLASKEMASKAGLEAGEKRETLAGEEQRAQEHNAFLQQVYGKRVDNAEGRKDDKELGVVTKDLDNKIGQASLVETYIKTPEKNRTKAFQEKAEQAAASSGVDIQGLQDQYDSQKSKYLGLAGDNTKAQQNLHAALGIDAYRKQREEALAARTRSVQPGTSPQSQQQAATATQQTPSQTISPQDLQAYVDTHYRGDPQGMTKATSFLQSQGYRILSH